MTAAATSGDSMRMTEPTPVGRGAGEARAVRRRLDAEPLPRDEGGDPLTLHPAPESTTRGVDM
jgi:hypothetical protein